MAIHRSAEPSDAAPAESGLSSSGRFIRAALVIFPLGLILLGIASFGIWKWKKDRVEDRSYQHASAMRQEPAPASWERHFTILTEVARADTASRLASTASYIESSLGAESMGYSPERFFAAATEQAKVAGVVAELTGRQRPRELVMVLLNFGSDQADSMQRENQGLASLLSLAHWMTGEPTLRTLRWVTLPMTALDAEGRRAALTRLGLEMRLRDERIIHLLIVDPDHARVAAEMETAFDIAARGTVVEALELPPTASAALETLPALRDRLLRLTGTP